MVDEDGAQLDGENLAENDLIEASEEAEVVEEGKEEENSSEETEAPKKTVYYVTDLQQQSQYVKMFREQDMNAVVLLHNIDQPFITQRIHIITANIVRHSQVFIRQPFI